MFEHTQDDAPQSLERLVLIESLAVGLLPKAVASFKVEMNGSYNGVCAKFAGWGIDTTDIETQPIVGPLAIGKHSDAVTINPHPRLIVKPSLHLAGIASCVHNL